jgi:hypothetical protein
MIAGAPHTFGIGYMCLAALSELGFWHPAESWKPLRPLCHDLDNADGIHGFVGQFQRS